MEDQQPDPGDLTDDAVAAAPVPEGKSARSRHRLPRQKLRQPGDEVAEVVESDTDTVEPEPVDVESSAVELTEEPEAVETGADETDVDEAEPILVPHQPAGRGLKLAAVAAGAVVVAAAAFAGATLQPYLADRAAVQVKLEVATTAAEAIQTLWTYTPDDIDKLADRTARYLGGDFATQYRQFIDGIVEANKQAQVTNSTEVKGAAVESLTSTEASAIVYTNSVSTSPVTKGIPSLRYLSYRLTLEHHGGHWLITRMQDITSLDLTPRL
ncbi:MULTISPECIES: mammalian cell entry protein [unclassified Mycobacterium]|uniref:mammalian cell entry protein n=1 Tax=unclassified Mycobacterium TaxID=2642494 RepID=UPI0029C8FA0B|nr:MULTISPECIES: mammalian cell entry protein [unclassified Mycobacterium]